MTKQPQKTQTKITSGFSWMKLIYSLIVIFLYVPLVFVGVRTFLPEYTDYYTYPVYKDCYGYNYDNTQCLSLEEKQEAMELRDQCLADQQAEQKTYDDAKRDYDTWRYLAILGIAVLTLVLMMFITFDTPIKIGLFIGSAAAVFISTMQYFETKSIPAFIVLLVVFCIIVFVIQKRERFFK